VKKDVIYIHFDTVGSTNNWAKAHAAELDPNRLTCITASEQTAGRGRFARKWVSPPGENIYATFYFCVPKGFPHLVNLGQILALSCASALRSLGFDPKIKWPNDILLAGKKAGGVLAETVDLKELRGCALGIGLNVNMGKEHLASTGQPATSLAQVSGRMWKLEEVLEPLLQQFLQDLEKLKKEGFGPFQAFLNELLAYKGQTISCRDGEALHEGICQGVDVKGTLELLLPSGQVVRILAGEVLIL